MATTTIRTGDVTVHRIVEQEAAFLPALEVIRGLSPELLAENRHWMEPAALNANGFLVLCFQSYVLRTPHRVILVDSCIGNHKQRPHRPKWHDKADDVYMTGLAAAGLRVEDIDIVMCTHLHADHVGWNTRLENGHWVPTFPNARYVFTATEYDHWTAANAKAPVTPFNDSVLPIVEARRADMVSGDHHIDDLVWLTPTPGHTPGHVAVCFGRDGARGVISGDLMHSPLQARYPELSAVFDVDPAQAAVTRRAFLEHYCDSGALCCPAHFPSPSWGHVKRWGDGFRCEPAGA
jgi:glyoxylase-like metal-dependent hydrolase (beta-lactamase superfamily II)